MRRDIDEKEHVLHLKRLQDGRDAIKGLGRATSLRPAFKHWQQRVERSLLKLFDEDHPYYDDFSSLSFSDGWPDEPDDWTPEDQQAFGRDLNAAERILADAIEESQHLAPSTATASVGENTKPAIPEPSRDPIEQSLAVHVNVYNVLSQMTVITTAQILASLQELDLTASDRAEAENVVKAVEREADGKQRWSRLGRSVDRLKELGGSVYEKVATPLLLEYLKREMGIGGP